MAWPEGIEKRSGAAMSTCSSGRLRRTRRLMHQNAASAASVESVISAEVRPGLHATATASAAAMNSASPVRVTTRMMRTSDGARRRAIQWRT